MTTRVNSFDLTGDQFDWLLTQMKRIEASAIEEIGFEADTLRDGDLRQLAIDLKRSSSIRNVLELAKK